MKVCNKCKVLKSLDCFYKGKTYKDGYRARCIECFKNYQQENKEHKKEYLKNYKELNKEILKLKNKEYRNKNYNKIQKWRNENEDYPKKYRQENSDKIKKYFQENKDKIRKINKLYQRKRIKEDPVYRFARNIRSLIRCSFKRGTNQFRKEAKTEKILGCTIEEFRLYIESKFTKEMTLENYGKWHIDHIIPLATATTEEEVVKLNHYTNLQPLWAKENLSKGKRYQLNH